MKGTCILANGNEPNGRFVQGIVSGTPAPGMAMEIVPATEPVNGLWTYRAYSVGTNGDRRPVIILLDDDTQGVTPDLNGANTYVSGSIVRLYFPINGDELNILVKNLAGTADSHAIGDLFMPDVASGKFLVQGSASNFAPFQCEETSVALTADTLLLCRCVF